MFTVRLHLSARWDARMVTPSRRQRTVNPLILLIAPLAKRRNQMIVLRGF